MEKKLLPKLIACALLGVVAMSSGYAQTKAPAKAPSGHAQHASASASAVKYRPDVTYKLRTDIADGKLVFVGEAGDIKGKVNPDIVVEEGTVIQINLVNGDGVLHDISVPDFNATSEKINQKGSGTVIVFRADKAGEFKYFCTIPGHVAAGMVGRLVVTKKGQKAAAAPAKATGIDISQNPMAVGEPVGARGPRTLNVDLETTEVTGQLMDGTTYRYWTFNNKVPGPFIRVRVGDTVNVNMANAKDSQFIHSVDFHAVTGPGGGAAVTQAAPGTSKGFTFKAINPGIYVYHCATPMVAHHISNGMYGLILVEPEGGLPKVDREFYVMQGEIYTTQKHGSTGEQEFSLEKLLDEKPEHIFFNGSHDALTKTHKMEANVGETVRIFFGVGGPNLTSSFHVIGEVFDRVFREGDLTSPPLQNVQTTTVAPGGATMVEFKVEVPGKLILVDHALSRLEKGLVGIMEVKGPENHEIFKSNSPIDPNSGH